MTNRCRIRNITGILSILALMLVSEVDLAAHPASVVRTGAAQATEYFAPAESATSGAPGSFRNRPNVCKPPLSWEPPEGKSYAVPAVEIAGFVVFLNGFSRLAYSDDAQKNGEKVYDTTPSTFWNNATHFDWTLDDDAFSTNQLLHSYQGSMYHGLARSTGLSYWESAGYTFLGSLLWEFAGETAKPSSNDQIASGIAGSFLGESLFRMSSLVLEGHGQPGFWREVAATLISPPLGFNRFIFGERFDVVFPSRDPALAWRLRVGPTFNTHISYGSDSGIGKTEAGASFSLEYGLPGKPGYMYTRPFDYFRFELGVVNDVHDPVTTLTSVGLLYGTDCESGNAGRGIYGVYGGYDYLSARIFRMSSTAASLGTTWQWWLSRLVALQGSGLLGIGYGASTNRTDQPEGDYHYGVTGQGLLSLRLILGDLLMVEGSGRGYYVSGLTSDQPHGRQFVQFFNLGATIRVHDRHALGIQFLQATRDAHSPRSSDWYQKLQSISLVYTFLSDIGFGAVEWRE